jgi:hypothetical protein
MKRVLKVVDQEPLASDLDMPRWRNSTLWVHNTMRHNRRLKDDLPHGV